MVECDKIYSRSSVWIKPLGWGRALVCHGNCRECDKLNTKVFTNGVASMLDKRKDVIISCESIYHTF